ncbi:MAG: hypothetical protein IPG67_12100 [Acidobacteria bacterium]|nr:hypothetical protein [Acidobacteriota bacterium]
MFDVPHRRFDLTGRRPKVEEIMANFYALIPKTLITPKVRIIEALFMNPIYIIIAISWFSVFAAAQSKSISQEDYESAHRYALSETNGRFPFVHTFTSEIFENEKMIASSTHVTERQGEGLERQTFTNTENGKTTRSYQLRTGFGDNVYCSTDGKVWTGPQKYECPRSIRIYRPRTPISVEYSLTEKTVAGKKVKEYRKFEVYGGDGKGAEFDEEIALIDADGLFISTIHTMGNVQSKQIKTRPPKPRRNLRR